MPPDLPNEQALILKKRARRRLVGAIALVLLMVIVLPRILEDRANQTTQESIKITMPEQLTENTPEESVKDVSNEDAPAVTELSSEAEIENLAAQQVQPTSQAIPPVPEVVAEPEKPEPVKTPAPTKASVKTETPSKTEAPAVKATQKAVEPGGDSGSFTVQVGVFSDAANVKQLQEKLKQAGFSSYTEKITTQNGQKIRLRAGKFATRQQASDALNTIKTAGLSGMVISN
jgi:DedD protein